MSQTMEKSKPDARGPRTQSEGRSLAPAAGRRAEADLWLPFSGGELEGRAPRRRCASCTRPSAAGERPVLCFECHRADLERGRAIRAAATLDTASEARFQDGLPFEPVNRARLAMLKVDRAASRAAEHTGAARFDVRRRQAILAARRALHRVMVGVHPRGAVTPEERRVLAMALHAAELQLPAAWLPFVVSR